MKPTPQYEFTAKQTSYLHTARKLAWVTIVYLVTAAFLKYLVLGTSQTMKTAWVDDLLSITAPISFLVSSYICWKKPNKSYPYGYHRAVSVSFLCSSLALLVSGGYLFIDAVIKLIYQTHPTIGLIHFAGYEIWLGWLMILALLYGLFPPMILGHFKLKIAPIIFDKVLYTDARMNRADWLMALVAITGILGIGAGYWWFDPVAASILSIDIFYDGLKQTTEAVVLLLDKAPCDLEGKEIDLPEKVVKLLEKKSWVQKADVRLREHGHLIYGEGFVKSGKEPINSEKIEKTTEEVLKLDWRLQSFVLTVNDA